MTSLVIFGVLVLAGLFSQVHTGEKYNYFSRETWHAKPAKKQTPMNGKPKMVLVKQIDYDRDCDTVSRKMQKTDMEKYHHDDIDCNFILTLNSVCEGRGWFNSVLGNKALVLCVMVNSHWGQLSSGYLYMIKSFLSTPDAKILLDPNYKFIMLRDMYPESLNPGMNLYNGVKKLPRYEKASTQTIYKPLWRKEESKFYLG